MWASLSNLMFGCMHRNTTFPISRRSRRGEVKKHDTYVVCLDCGKEFPYSWEEMRIVKQEAPTQPAVEHAVEMISGK